MSADVLFAYQDDSDGVEGYRKYHRDFDQYQDAQVDYRYEFIDDMVDVFLELRGQAEAACKYGGFTNKKDALPLSVKEVAEVLGRREGKEEPPYSLVVVIAQKHLEHIIRLADSLHNQLRSNREKVPLDRAQQLDSQCLQWLTKQPGRTFIEKAGTRQRVMAVVRYQSFNTLENRIFKQLLTLSVRECRKYVKKYEQAYPHATRLKLVRRMQAIAETILRRPVFLAIQPVTGSVIPNYVLQNNPSYRIIWNLYRQLLHQGSVREKVWMHRDVAFKDFVRLYVEVALFEQAPKTVFSDPLWIDLEPDKEGRFIASSGWRSCYSFSNAQVECYPKSKSVFWPWEFRKAPKDTHVKSSYRIHGTYVKESTAEFKVMDSASFSIIYCESKHTLHGGPFAWQSILYPEPDLGSRLHALLKESLPW